MQVGASDVNDIRNRSAVDWAFREGVRRALCIVAFRVESVLDALSHNVNGIGSVRSVRLLNQYFTSTSGRQRWQLTLQLV